MKGEQRYISEVFVCILASTRLVKDQKSSGESSFFFLFFFFTFLLVFFIILSIYLFFFLLPFASAPIYIYFPTPSNFRQHISETLDIFCLLHTVPTLLIDTIHNSVLIYTMWIFPFQNRVFVFVYSSHSPLFTH